MKSRDQIFHVQSNYQMKLTSFACSHFYKAELVVNIHWATFPSNIIVASYPQINNNQVGQPTAL